MKVKEFHASLRQALPNLLPLLRYLVLQTETHAFCLALACAALVAFYPFCFLMLSLVKYGLHWEPAYNVLVSALREYYPTGQDFLIRNLQVSVAKFGSSLEIDSILWIILGGAGIFIPLEAGFNRLWNVHEDRPYWKNQMVGFSLTLVCSVLAFLFVMVTAMMQSLVVWAIPFKVLQRAAQYVIFKLIAVCFWAAAIFILYKFLPNARIETMRALPAAVLAGIVAEVVRNIYTFVLPWMDVQKSQGPYYVSVSFVLLVYFETFVLLGGAFLATETRRYPWLSTAFQNYGDV